MRGKKLSKSKKFIRFCLGNAYQGKIILAVGKPEKTTFTGSHEDGEDEDKKKMVV